MSAEKEGLENLATCAYFTLIDQRGGLVLRTPTGCAAANIDGCTLHSVLGIKIYWEREKQRENMLSGKSLASQQRRCKMFKVLLLMNALWLIALS